MKRFGLLLALALSLLPSGAAAEMRAPEREHEEQVVRAADVYGSDALRSSSGLEALRFLRTDRHREPSNRHRADGAPPVPAVVLPSQPVQLAVSLSAPETEVVAPLCERLPYHSTAPPSRR